MRRLLMPEDWIGHPLRKDFVEPQEYHGISTVRESPIIRLDSHRQKMSTLHTEEMTLNMGPQHPSTHGVLRFIVHADGEVMREAIPDVGYLHRSIEKIAEKVGYHGFMPYTDRVDYVCAMFTNQGWGMACEKLGGHRGAASAASTAASSRRSSTASHRICCRSARWRWISARSRRSPMRSASAR